MEQSSFCYMRERGSNLVATVILCTRVRVCVHVNGLTCLVHLLSPAGQAEMESDALNISVGAPLGFHFSSFVPPISSAHFLLSSSLLA